MCIHCEPGWTAQAAATGKESWVTQELCITSLHFTQLFLFVSVWLKNKTKPQQNKQHNKTSQRSNYSRIFRIFQIPNHHSSFRPLPSRYMAHKKLNLFKSQQVGGGRAGRQWGQHRHQRLNLKGFGLSQGRVWDPVSAPREVPAICLGLQHNSKLTLKRAHSLKAGFLSFHWSNYIYQVSWYLPTKLRFLLLFLALSKYQLHTSHPEWMQRALYKRASGWRR